MRPLRLISTLAILIAGTAAIAGTPAKLGPAPVLGGGEYSTGGGVTVAIELRNWAGKTGLCGIWAESERLTAYVRHKGNVVLAKGSIALGNEVLTYNLNFLQQVAPSQSYAGAPAGCVRLNRDWRASDANRRLEVRIPRQELHFGRSGTRGGGLRVTFRDTGHANPALTSGSLLPKKWTSFGSWSGKIE
ncbi:MAG: hypothetical protein RID23_12490 [Roseovarius sp.]